jgi:hypothetical protein
MVRVPGSHFLGIVVFALLTAGCGSTGLAPVSYPDPSVACPGGLPGWKLEILDRRVRRDGSEGVQALIGNSIRQSFPGCQWEAAAGAGAGRVQIEIHRFVANPDGNTWEAVADWSVLVTDPSGRTLTEFDATEEVSRPNYRGSNNEKEALRQAFDQAMRRTLAGLRSVTSGAVLRLPGRTDSEGDRFAGLREGFVSHSPNETCRSESERSAGIGLERFSQHRTSEVL